MANTDDMQKKHLIAMLLLLLAATGMRAQQGASPGLKISGKVIDGADQMAMPGATVFLYPADTLKKKVTITDTDGSFSFAGIEPGSYHIRVTSIGYLPYEGKLFQLGRDMQLPVISVSEDSHMLSGVTITGSSKKKLVENKGDRIVYNAASDISNKSGNASDVLRKVPLLTVGAEGELKMRGNANIKVLLNGLPSGIMARNLKEALKMIPASTIESIEVITSPSAKYEAEGAAGVINIITKKKLRGTSGTVDLSGGNLEQNASILLNHSVGKFNLSMSLNANNSHQRSRSSVERNTFSGGSTVGSLLQESDRTSDNRGGYGNLTAEYRIDTTQSLEASASYWNGQWPERARFLNRNQTGTMLDTYRQQNRQDGSYNYYELMLNYRKKFSRPSQELQLVAEGSISDDISRYTTDQFTMDNAHAYTELGNNSGTSKDWSLQVDYTQPLGTSGKSTFDLGARYLGSISKSDYRVTNTQGGADASRTDLMSHFQDICAAYLSLNIQLAEGLTLRPGLRYEHTSMGGEFRANSPSFSRRFSNLLPGVLLINQLNEAHELKLNYSERVRRPWIWDLNPFVNASDPLNLTAGNPGLRPELTRTLELGHAYNAASAKVSLNSSIYLNMNSNAVEAITTVNAQGISMTTSQNIASNRRIGANSNLFIRPLRRWTLNLGADVFYLKFRSVAIGMLTDGYFYTANLSTSIELPRNYSVQASGEYGNGFITLQGHTSANYTYRFGLAREMFSQKATLTLNVNNPFRQTFVQRSTAAAPTFDSRTLQHFYNRSFSLSFSWRFGTMRGGERTEQKARPESGRGNRG